MLCPCSPGESMRIRNLQLSFHPLGDKLTEQSISIEKLVCKKQMRRITTNSMITEWTFQQLIWQLIQLLHPSRRTLIGVFTWMKLLGNRCSLSRRFQVVTPVVSDRIYSTPIELPIDIQLKIDITDECSTSFSTNYDGIDTREIKDEFDFSTQTDAAMLNS